MLIMRGQRLSVYGPLHLGNVFILIVLLSIVIDEDATHAEIRKNRGVFFLKETDR